MKTILKGVLVGIANSVPGVSGGTVLVLTNSWKQTIEAIQNPKKHFTFLLKLLSGIVLGIVLFSHVVSYSLSIARIPTFYLFIGLIIGGTITFKKTNVFISCYRWMAFGVLTVLGIEYLPWYEGNYFFMMLLAGILVGATTILPGISGALLLLILNQYERVIGYIKEFTRFDFTHWLHLLYIGLGIIIGLYFMSVLLNNLLKNKYNLLMNYILGLLIGSVIVLLPTRGYDITAAFSIVTLPLGVWMGSLQLNK